MATETRITHALAEVLRAGDPRARITHALAEVLRVGDPRARITHAVVEVLRGLETAPSGWTGKICGVTNPSKICGVAVANISKVNRV